MPTLFYPLFVLALSVANAFVGLANADHLVVLKNDEKEVMDYSSAVK